MKILTVISFLLITTATIGQQRLNPIIPDYGGIFAIPYAEEKPDPALQYNIVIDVASGSENSGQLNDALNNLASIIFKFFWIST